jgi:branched-chain amino acid transport system ATP-binding protein
MPDSPDQVLATSSAAFCPTLFCCKKAASVSEGRSPGVNLNKLKLGRWPLVSQALGRIQQISKDAGMTVVIVEHKVREVLKIARRVYILRTGQISVAGPAEALGDDAKLREVYL